jgi:hypothetical protein
MITVVVALAWALLDAKARDLGPYCNVPATAEGWWSASEQHLSNVEQERANQQPSVVQPEPLPVELVQAETRSPTTSWISSGRLWPAGPGFRGVVIREGVNTASQP